MRMKPHEIEAVTGLTQTAAQARWFKTHFGVTLSSDKCGPIITQAAFEKLVERKCGLEPQAKPRPEVRPTK